MKEDGRKKKIKKTIMGLEEIRKLKESAGLPKPKKQYSIPKMSAKKLAKEKAEKEERGDNDTELQKWYRQRQKQLVGECTRCGHKYDHKDFKQAVHATAHILPKRDAGFPSVKTHPLNWIELSPWCGCHGWMDDNATWEEIISDPKIGKIITERFSHVELCIAPEEKHRIPEALRAYISPLPF